MAARSPRKLFASSFVVTVATLPACFTSTPPPDQPRQQPVTQQPARPDETSVVANPPRPAQGGTVQASTPSSDQRWMVMKSGETCSAMMRVDCPKPTTPGGPVPTCNPPPPMKIECPSGWDGKNALSVVQYANTTECVIEPEAVKCPPNTKCNPPPPRKVACPTYQ